MCKRKTQPVFRDDGTYVHLPEPIHPGEAMRCTYYNTHRPSGRIYPESALFVNRNAFERCLVLWNMRGGELWRYTEALPPEAPDASTADSS